MDAGKRNLRWSVSTALRAALLASCAFGVAHAQTPASSALPSGLVKQGNVIMMAPIPDGDEAGAVPYSGGERRAGLAHLLGATDHELYEHAFEAADHGDWTAARGLADQGHDPIARLIIQWRYLLDKNSGASFGEISEFLRTYPDWPNRDTLFARAERAMDPNMDPHAIIAWFGDRTPASDIGRVRLGGAMIATGSLARGQELVREGWVDGSFEPDQEFLIIQRYGTLLTPDVDRARLQRLISRNDITEARREFSRVETGDQKIAETRLTLRTSPTVGQQMLDQLSEGAKDDPGIIFDQTRLLRQQMSVDAIPQLLVKAPTREMALVSPTRWWNELNQDVRTALQISNYASAYAIANHTGLIADDGTNYSDAEFLAGWIALRFLKDPQSALVHFKNLANAVSRPISRARAHYWEGRSLEATGDLGGAWQQYKVAAETPEVFYGQLALAHISMQPELHLRDQQIDSTALAPEFEHEALTRAIRVLADLGEENFLRDFAVQDASIYDDPRHIKLLAEDLVRMGFKEVALRVAKTASYSNISLPTYSHPVISIPAYVGPGTAPESALVLGIIRQETEFDPDAVSSAGARGIIQVMPNSVRHFASVGGLPYRPNALTTDPTYDLQLGMTELAGELSDWGGSYVLAIAAYNAGPNNVRRWIAQYGDPRDARVDPIDWIEEIPFSETRNYVQRVLENTEVYRNRLAGHDQKLQILADLYRPDSIQSRPLIYSPPPPAATPQSQGAVIPVPVPKPDEPPSNNGPTTSPTTGGPQSTASVTPMPVARPVETTDPQPKPNPDR
jgi:soluble lytic murein transglycosylase